MNSRLDTYLTKLKDDVDKITNKNRVLFEDFMERTRDVDLRYIEMEKRIQSQYDFFSENKLRYQQSIDRMEQLGVQLKTQEDTSDKHVQDLREEIDKINDRINEKDKVVFNTVKQVCEMDFRVTENRAFNLESRKKVMTNKRYLMVLQPLNQMKMIMNCLKEVTMGS